MVQSKLRTMRLKILSIHIGLLALFLQILEAYRKYSRLEKANNLLQQIRILLLKDPIDSPE